MEESTKLFPVIDRGVCAVSMWMEAHSLPRMDNFFRVRYCLLLSSGSTVPQVLLSQVFQFGVEISRCMAGFGLCRVG